MNTQKIKSVGGHDTSKRIPFTELQVNKNQHGRRKSQSAIKVTKKPKLQIK